MILTWIPVKRTKIRRTKMISTSGLSLAFREYICSE
jgi:hypothetical protein